MKKFSFNLVLRGIFCAAALLAVNLNASATTLMHVHLDTTALNGDGWLDMQFNPGMDSAPSAMASISNFSGMLNDAELPQIAGDVSGILPSTLVFHNSSFFNDFFQAVHFGGNFDFNVEFSGAFFDAISDIGTTFSVSLYGNDQVSILGNADAAGSLLNFELTPASAFTLGSVTSNIVDSSIVSLSEVSEPPMLILMLGGLISFLTLRRKMTSK